jgi:ribosomal protein S18 acetylase RimI-like enzyme
VVTIRTGTNADIDAVLAFWRDATTEPSSTDDAASLSVLLAHAPDSLMLAGERDTLVGTVIVGWDGWRGGLYRLAVAPSRRRTGIATALIEEAERRLRGLGAQRLHLIVAGDQEPARAFWRAAGYESTDQLRFVKTFEGGPPHAAQA